MTVQMSGRDAGGEDFLDLRPPLLLDVGRAHSSQDERPPQARRRSIELSLAIYQAGDVETSGNGLPFREVQMNPDPQARRLERQGHRGFEGFTVGQEACAGDHAPTMPVEDCSVDVRCQAEVVRVNDQSFHASLRGPPWA